MGEDTSETLAYKYNLEEAPKVIWMYSVAQLNINA